MPAVHFPPTENAIEGLAEASNGSVLALDEMGHADGKMVGRMIYSIASGIGKARATKDAQLQDRHKWATFAILSGEIPLETKVSDNRNRHPSTAATISSHPD